jgi:5-enolpyruvylshikimate-3-phosphate synthase
VPLAIDELPLFALAAACARGESVLRGAEELRAKETDRIEATVDALRALGVRAPRDRRRLPITGVPAGPRRADREPRRPPHRDARRGRRPRLARGVRIEDADASA